MRKVLFLAFLCLSAMSAVAQVLAPITWEIYGLTFNAPRGMVVEEDTDDTYLLNSNKLYINIQSLDPEGLDESELNDMLKGYAADDGVTEPSELQPLDLDQFRGSFMRGICNGEHCFHACLLTKEGEPLCFYVSIIWVDGQEANAEKVLKSFKIKE